MCRVTFCVVRTVAENLCSKTWIVDAIVVMGLRWGEVRLWEVAVVGVRCHFLFETSLVCFRIFRLNFPVSSDHRAFVMCFVCVVAC